MKSLNNLSNGKTLGKQGGKVWIGWIWLRMGSKVGSCEYGEPLGAIKDRKFVD
jgi:hypothetical protein